LPRGRILKATPGEERATSAGTSGAGARAGRRIAKSVVDANRLAAARLEAADEKARAVVAEAEDAARIVGARALEEARQAAAAELVGAWARLRAEEAKSNEKNVERLVELARAMAERVLSESLRLHPETVLAIAHQVLASARHAKRIALRAHPEDADVIRRAIASLPLEHDVFEIHADEARPRGGLLLDTDLGFLDANLTVQLDRLARALRDSLRS
jgi:flagellar biosynthesis/type III secretory pathway protein FliH